jgi:prolipoprotein diacylglyceryltransferase
MGRLFGIFLTLVFVARFIIEYFKQNQSELEQNMALHIGQYLSIPFIIIGIYYWIKSYKKVPLNSNN